MRDMKTRAAALILMCWASAAAQQPGVPPPWEVKKAIAELEKYSQTVENLLAQLRPAEWIKDGAPELYRQQWQQARQVNGQVRSQAQALAEQPEKLTLALDTFFRLDYLESLLESVNGGVRKYQNAALGDLLSAAISRNSAAREGLREYVQQLATDRENEWEVAHREAQRCREVLSKQPPSPSPKPAPPKP